MSTGQGSVAVLAPEKVTVGLAWDRLCMRHRPCGMSGTLAVNMGHRTGPNIARIFSAKYLKWANWVS